MPGTIGDAEAGAGRARRCGRAKGARIIMIPSSMRDGPGRKALSRELDPAIEKIRRRGEVVDTGLIRAKEAIEDEKNHLLVARSRWGELLGSLSYTFPDATSLRVDFIGVSIHRCGLGTRLMGAVAEIALRGNRRIILTAEKGAKGFFERLGMELLEEYPDGNCAFEISGDGLRRIVEASRTSP